jgi:large subunit ribosomal protein L35
MRGAEIDLWNLNLRFLWSLGFGVFAGVDSRVAESICHRHAGIYLSRLMPKAIARSKTRKSVAKRFKITAKGKILRAHASRRHLLSAKNAKRKRQLSKAGLVHHTDMARIKANLPFA